MKKRTIVAGVSALLILAILLYVILSVAKYITKKEQQNELTSQNFYFSSNFLKSDEVPTYEIYGNTVTFSVRKYIDSLRVNDTDIDFIVTADGGSVGPESGSLTKTAPSADITLTYEFGTDELQKEITVSVTGTGDFTQTLKAKFILIKTDSMRYEIKDQKDRDYAELYIYTGNTASDITINWDKANFLIDETNDYIFGNTNLNAEKNSVTITAADIPADTTVKVVFFKQDIAQNYTCGITKSDGTINMPGN